MPLYLTRFSYTPATWAKLIQTTVLLTVEEMLAALKKASSIRYRPSGDKS